VSVQPYREEINRIISIYIADGGSRQLNLSSKERTALLHALQNTTHPSAFKDVMITVEWSLRCQAHPNFIRWTICNGNRPRVVFARGLGIGGIVAGLIVAIILTLSNAGRGWRVMSLIGFFIGISTLIAAWKGMCVVLHGMHHRHLRPWELFASDDEAQSYDAKLDSMDTLGSHASSNSWEDEPWVARYEKRNVIRKIFDREVWIQEPALRQIQDTIFLQSILGALIISAVAVGIFCAIPKGNYF
jgi:MFS family permease